MRRYVRRDLKRPAASIEAISALQRGDAPASIAEILVRDLKGVQLDFVEHAVLLPLDDALPVLRELAERTAHAEVRQSILLRLKPHAGDERVRALAQRFLKDRRKRVRDAAAWLVHGVAWFKDRIEGSISSPDM